ncbi:uncharacterized protein [Arachis hypogaea]|uniref:uncharacterized protein n=1 Tax=Arachis hypogaea TaxID=3818 RepID=UPI003B213AF9
MVKSERLKFFRYKQPQLRIDKYKYLHESLINGNVDAAKFGRRIVLLNTFTGGPRYMMNNCKDAFAICRYAGYPSYFITMTYVCTIEFQKRGLPHAHILLFMSIEFKPQTPDDINKHITVKISDENERPNLHGAVQNYMVHGPCGPYNKNSPCMKNGPCSKFYPKEFRQRTLINEVEFFKYRHTDNSRTVNKRECVLYNKFIVAYNPELLLKFGCHINLEYICQTSSIKYLFKYVHKGNDRITTTLYNTGDPSEATQVVDKIRNYYDCRYI